jgi:hypothetical protein
MLYLSRNQNNTLKIKVCDRNLNNNSGIYILNLRHISTNEITLLTLIDTSTLKNSYSKFTISSGQTNNLNIGQHYLEIYDILSGNTLLYKEIVTVNDTNPNQNIYFLNTSNQNEIYGITGTTSNLPTTPINLNLVLTESNDIELTYLKGSSNTNSFEIQRKIGTGGTYIIIANNHQFLTYTDANLEANTTYTYKIKAKNNNGNSDFTNEISITTG